jgi:hypothetical protein
VNFDERDGVAGTDSTDRSVVDVHPDIGRIDRQNHIIGSIIRIGFVELPLNRAAVGPAACR